MTSPFKQVARDLHARGLSTIPLKPKSQIPAIKSWSKYAQELPTIEEITEWEKIKDANVAIVMGEVSGIIGLDFDYDVDNSHEKIKKYLDTEDTVIKKGHKGCTMFFQYDKEETKGWSIEGSRVLDLLSNKSYTVVPPSIHPEGDTYQYESLIDLEDVSEIPKLPTTFVANVNKLLDNRVEKKKTTGDLNVDIKEVEEALVFINNTGNKIDYDTWLHIGMALKSDLGEDGFKLWDEWSARSSKYTPKDMLYKWSSFKKEGITLGSLFRLAMEAGFEFSENKISLEGITKPIDLSDDLEDWRQNGIDRGLESGYSNLDKLIHFKRGEFIVWTGYANNGKSEIVDSISLELMKKGWKYLYCSLEKLPKSHVQSLVHKITGVPIEERSKDAQQEALALLNQHCAMVSRKDFIPSIDNIFKMAKIYKNVYGLDAIVIDPFNYISSPHKGDIFNHTAYVLEKCTFMAQSLDISVQMVAHPKKPDKVFGKRLPRLTMYSISGNADFANMSDIMVAVYKTIDNTNRIEVLKVRDQDVDSTGVCEFSFDKVTKRHAPYDMLEDL